MLFDTDVLIWFLRGTEKAACFFEREPLRLISQVTWMEIVQGAHNKRELARLKSALLLMGVETVPLNESIGNRAIDYMEQHSLKDGLMLADALVGATAAEHGLILATANVKHFRHLTGVKIHPYKP